MYDAQKGDWVQIHKIVLEVGKRAPNLPQETQEVPLELRVRGFLLDKEAKQGEQVMIETLIGRRLSGKLEEVNPIYKHNFGRPIPELLKIGLELKAFLKVSDE